MRAVLFDLDGTLLDIDIDEFLRRYFGRLGPLVSELLGGRADATQAIEVVMGATRAMMRDHPGRTNQEVFDATFLEATGVDRDEAYARFAHFYETEFPSLRDSLAPAVGGVEAVETALSLGLRVAVATNPIFPESAIRQRMAWAGVADLDIPVVTTFEIMHACKPHAAYFLETADLLGVPPTSCLMVGDDPQLDMPAANVGMSTYFVGPKPPASATFSGSLSGLVSLLPRIASN